MNQRRGLATRLSQIANLRSQISNLEVSNLEISNLKSQIVNLHSRMPQLSLSIDGMSCGHCVSAVREALESVPGVTVMSVAVGSATVDAPDPAPIDSIRQAVEDAGYFAEVKAA